MKNTKDSSSAGTLVVKCQRFSTINYSATISINYQMKLNENQPEPKEHIQLYLHLHAACDDGPQIHHYPRRIYAS